MPDTSRFHLKLKDSFNAHSPAGALGVFAPTHATLRHPDDSVEDLQWSARAHRKRRYRRLDEKGRPLQDVETLWTKLRRFGNLEWKETSWWIAVFFTVGSIVWVINGFIVFLPQLKPSKYAVNNVGGGWTAWLGATIFEFGAVTALFEAMNRNDEVKIGGDQAAQNSPSDDEEKALKQTHDNNEDTSSRPKRKQKLIFFPYKKALWSEIGFWAAFVQFWAATIFWISGWTGIPEIFTPVENKGSALENGVYWVPQIIGGSGFVIASVLYMLESQKKWWKPEPSSLGWQVGFWNLIGAIGFDLCGIFGLSTFVPADVKRNWSTIQSTCSTFWGGWAFLIGSIIQWWEAVQPATTTGSDDDSEEDENGNANEKKKNGVIGSNRQPGQEDEEEGEGENERERVEGTGNGP